MAKPNCAISSGAARYSAAATSSRRVVVGDRDEQRATDVMGRQANRCILPMRNLQLRCGRHCACAHGLPQSQSQARGRVRDILPKHQYGICRLRILQGRGCEQYRCSGYRQSVAETFCLDPRRRHKILRPDQGAQGEIGFKRGARRADANDPVRRASKSSANFASAVPPPLGLG